MATTHFSISRFSGAKYGTADDLVQLGYASEAVNVDTSDGALQTLVGAVPYPKILDTSGLHFNPRLMWESRDGTVMFIDHDRIVQVYLDFVGEVGDQTHGRVVYAPESSEERGYLSHVERLFRTTIDGELVVIGLSHAYGDGQFFNKGPVVIGFEDGNYYVRPFGTGMFLTSDEITGVFTNESDQITGVRVDRVFSDDEIVRCNYAGVYIMETEDEELDFTAAYIKVCRLFEDHTTLVFKDPLPAASVEVGNYVKVRGGLSDQPVSFMHMHFGRLFAAGDPNFPNRLYWSCLPGDGRTIEDWTADDASPETGGGYVQVGDVGYISALFSYRDQLLIWKGSELWRLYGATPSQYTLELVYSGAGQEYPNLDTWPIYMQDRIADVHGVPYVLLDTGLYYYDGSGLAQASSDRVIRAFAQQRSGPSVFNYGNDFSKGVLGADFVCFYNGCLYFRPLGDYGGSAGVVKYDISTGTLIEYDYQTCVATGQGILVADKGIGVNNRLRLYLLLDDLEMRSDVLDYNGAHDPTFRWEDAYHYIVEQNGSQGPINAVWESHDLTFGEVSYTKKLRRIGLDVTGPIRVQVKTPEHGLYDQVFDMTDRRARRFLWIPVDMPYECSFRIRFESVDGAPFRVHNGVDFYIETSQRN